MEKMAHSLRLVLKYNPTLQNSTISVKKNIKITVEWIVNIYIYLGSKKQKLSIFNEEWNRIDVLIISYLFIQTIVYNLNDEYITQFPDCVNANYSD